MPCRGSEASLAPGRRCLDWRVECACAAEKGSVGQGSCRHIPFALLRLFRLPPSTPFLSLLPLATVTVPVALHEALEGCGARSFLRSLVVGRRVMRAGRSSSTVIAVRFIPSPGLSIPDR